MEYKEIQEKLRTPEELLPAQIKDFYLYLSELYSRKQIEASESRASVIRTQVEFLEKGMSNTEAKTRAMASMDGQNLIKLEAGLKGTMEEINALKRAQKYYEDNARNQY